MLGSEALHAAGCTQHQAACCQRLALRREHCEAREVISAHRGERHPHNSRCTPETPASFLVEDRHQVLVSCQAVIVMISVNLVDVEISSLRHFHLILLVLFLHNNYYTHLLIHFILRGFGVFL